MTEPEAIFKKNNLRALAHIGLCILAALMLYGAAKMYSRTYTSELDEEIGFITVIWILGGVYTGRFISHLWIGKQNNVSGRALLILPVLIIILSFLTAMFISTLIYHHELMAVVLLALSSFAWSVSTGIFIKLVRTKITARIQTAEINASQSESELHLLQSQLSPHFLFNTLNNLYGISIAQPEKIPTLLLKLSDLLRYSVYEAKEMFVPLKDELSYLNNYIDFEKIRIGDRLNLKLDLETLSGKDIKIAPMLLIVFIENAFKHSKNTTDQKIYVEIALKVWANSILIAIKNSKKAGTLDNAITGKDSGLGLDNVKKRLELLYPGQYDLKTEDEKESYSIMLRLNVK